MDVIGPPTPGGHATAVIDQTPWQCNAHVASHPMPVGAVREPPHRMAAPARIDHGNAINERRGGS